MSVAMMSLVWKCAPYSGNSLLVLLALADWSNDEGACWPSMASIAAKARIEKRSAQRIVRNLVSNGYLNIEDRAGKKGQHCYYIQTEGMTKCHPLEATLPTQGMTEQSKEMTPASSDPSKEPSVELTAILEPPYRSKEFLEALHDWEQHKKEIRDPLRPMGRKKLYKQLTAMGEQRAIVAIDYSITRGWRGVFEPNSGSNGRNGPSMSTKADRSVEAARQAAAEFRNGTGS